MKKIFPFLLILFHFCLGPITKVQAQSPNLDVTILPFGDDCSTGMFDTFMVRVTPAVPGVTYSYRMNQSPTVYFVVPATAPTNDTQYFIAVDNTTTTVQTVSIGIFTPGPPVDVYHYTNIFTQADFCSNTVSGSFTKGGLCTNNTLMGMPFTLRIDSNNVPIDTVTSSYGFYGKAFSNNNASTSVYSITPIQLPPGFALTCPAAGAYTFMMDTITNRKLNFGVNCSPTNSSDLSVYTSGVYCMSPAPFSSYIMMNVGNSSCTPQSATLTLNIDPYYSYTTSNINPASQNGQTISWNIPSIPAGGNVIVYAYLSANFNASPGLVSCSDASVTISPIELTPNNNVSTLCDTIKGSWDPNDKKVMPSGNITAGQELTYTINFENTGTDTAFNVLILDTLSANLDLNTFKVVHSSHAVQTSFFQSNQQTVCQFRFKDILLGDKNHPNENKGYIIYQVKAKDNLVANDQISNNAGIYFDINPPIITNTVVSTIGEVTSLNDANDYRKDIQIYPNPANSVLNIIQKRSPIADEAFIYDLTGRLVMSTKISSANHTLDVHQIVSGTYFMSLYQQEQKLTTFKINISNSR